MKQLLVSSTAECPPTHDIHCALLPSLQCCAAMYLRCPALPAVPALFHCVGVRVPARSGSNITTTAQLVPGTQQVRCQHWAGAAVALPPLLTHGSTYLRRHLDAAFVHTCDESKDMLRSSLPNSPKVLLPCSTHSPAAAVLLPFGLLRPWGHVRVFGLPKSSCV